MEERNYTEQDWKLFRSRIPGWQDAYMNKMNMEYAALLAGEGKASDKFWALEERLRRDQQSHGVIVEMRRSRLVQNMVRLLCDGVISLDDLEGFSDKLRETLSFMSRP